MIKGVVMEISNQIISVIDALCEKLGIAIDWTQQNVLPQIQLLFEKYIRYEIISSIVIILIPTLASVALFMAVKKCNTIMTQEDAKEERRGDKFKNAECVKEIVTLGLCISSFITFCILCKQSMDIIRCLTIPELQVAKYFKLLA